MNSAFNWIVPFTVTFLSASLVSGVFYWLACQPSTGMLWVRRVFSAIACLVTLVMSVGLLATFPPILVLSGLLITVLASGVQTHIEANIEGGSLKKKHQFARSFMTYLCSAALIIMVMIVVTPLVVNPSRPNVWWTRAIIPGAWGVISGLLIAPPSISFCRWMFQSLHLRPGFDRPLHEKELLK
ncbi:MAG: hypothetical protein EOP04_05975 [Proteobacteria bacterium]|nr:MAG: hypothetical protein EOP04_05975 [Pseudomonadota bacterium]